MANLNINKQWESCRICTGSVYAHQIRFIDNATGPVAVAWPTANLAIYLQLLLRASATWNQAFVENGVPSGTLDLALYDENSNKLWSAGGNITQTGTTIPQAFSISPALKLQPGRYWMGLVVSNTTATYRGYTNAGAASCAAIHKVVGCQQQAVGSVVMPSSPTFATAVNNFAPQMGLEQTTLAI